MAIHTQLSEEIPERTTPILSATFQDENKNTITSGFDSIVGTLYDEVSGDIINSRDGFDLSPFVTSGVMSWTMGQLDTVIVDTTLDRESHILLVEWNWDTTKYGAHEIRMIIRNLTKVP